jgi:hypothetical protein
MNLSGCKQQLAHYFCTGSTLHNHCLGQSQLLRVACTQRQQNLREFRARQARNAASPGKHPFLLGVTAQEAADKLAAYAGYSGKRAARDAAAPDAWDTEESPDTAVGFDVFASFKTSFNHTEVLESSKKAKAEDKEVGSTLYEAGWIH